MPKIRFFDPAQETPPQKTTYRLTNWPDYNRALIQRGALSLWLDEQTLADWYYQGPQPAGGAYLYSDACIQCALSLKAVLGLAFRQTQGLIHSLLDSMKLNLQTPSYTQLCRRQARLKTASQPPQPPSTLSDPLHLVVDSTGLKVYGEGERSAAAVERQNTRGQQTTYLAKTAFGPGPGQRSDPGRGLDHQRHQRCRYAPASAG